MGLLARFLGWLWRRWADYQSATTLWDLLDLKTTVLGAIGFIAMMIFGATDEGWSAPAVVLAALIAGACVALITIAVRLVLARRKSSRSAEAPAGRSASTLMSDWQEGKWEFKYPPVKTSVPDWPIRDLFARIRPDLSLTSVRKEGNSTVYDLDERWKQVGDDVLKQLSLGRLHASGREIQKTRRLQPALIPSVFWRTAKFTYWFLDRDGLDGLHAENDDGIQYANLEVNKAIASEIWPDHRALPIRISLQDFLHVEAVKIGWAPRPGNQTDLAELLARVNQAAIDDELHFWGREAPITLKALLAHRPLVRIKKEYWEHHDIEYTHAIFSKNTDNYSQRALIHSRAIDGQESYRDLHLDRQEALHWLQSKGRP